MYLTADGGILGPITKIFGILMNFIYIGLEKIGIGNIGIAIIVFTLITRIILYPSSLKQQKSTKLMNIIQPEMKAIQDKYKGRQDQASMMAQQAEMRELQEKYGVSMGGSCLQLLIQMPIIFALYKVIMDVPAYVSSIRVHFVNIVEAIGGIDAIPKLTKFAQDNKLDTILKQINNFGVNDTAKFNVEAQKNFIIDFLYKLNPQQISNLAKEFGSEAQNVITTEMQYLNKANSFCGLNLSTAPNAFGIVSPYIVVPILAGVSQYLSVIIMQKGTSNKMMNDENNQMAQSMKTMNIMMPIISCWFCFTFATGIGVYWIASSVFMILQQIVINKQMEKIDVEELIKANIKKANLKRTKKGLPALNEEKLTLNLERMEQKEQQKEQQRANLLENQKKRIEENEKVYFENEDKNSLMAKVRMVEKYNENHNK